MVPDQGLSRLVPICSGLLKGSDDDVLEGEQPDYRLETIDDDTRRLLLRLAQVREGDHDVFTDYDEDPLFS